MAGKPRWAIHLIAAVTLVVFLTFVTGSASAAVIHGIVLDTNGVKVAGVTVTLYQGGDEYSGLNNPTKSDATGYYEFSGLPAGTYSVQAHEARGGFFSRSESATVGNSDAKVDLHIPGYDSQVAMPTVQAYVTITPTPRPPTPTPTPKPSPTLVPLPTPVPEPGFGLLLALLSIGAVTAIRRFK